MHREDEKFDMMIRSILDEGQEEVPARIWDTISSRLDNIESPVTDKKTKPVIIWLRNTGIGLAAAAAIATAVIFIGTIPENTIHNDSPLAVSETPHSDTDGTIDIISPDNPILADASVKTYASIRHLQNDDKVQSSENIDNMTVTSVIQAEEALDKQSSEDGVSQETHKTAATEKTGEREKQNNEYVLDNPFDDFTDDTDNRKIETSFTVFGNATSNSNAQRAKDMAFRAPGAPAKSTVIESGDSRYGIPVSFGIGAKLSFTRHWSMSIGVNYSFLSRTFDGNFYDVKEDGTYTNTHFTDIRNTQNYIGIPVNVYYSILQGKFVDFYAYAGGSAEYCLNNKYLMTGTEGNLTHKGEAGSFQFSANAGIGVEFIVAQRLGIYIDPSVRYYFRNSRAPKNIRTDQPLMLAFEAGLRIRF